MHTGPEALGQVFSPLWMLHSDKLIRGAGALKPGKPYASIGTTLRLHVVGGLPCAVHCRWTLGATGRHHPG